MKDLGCFIEYEFPKGKDLLFEDVPETDIVRLNSCRAAIYHAVRCYDVDKVWLATYQCDEVRDFLLSKGLKVLYYEIDEHFDPVLPSTADMSDSAIVLSNYFGLFGDRHFHPLMNRFRNVIIDNAQALYYPPQEGCISCYSPRKFVAAPDGAYVIGRNVNRFEYEQDYSSDTCKFLFMRSEYGCDMHAYSFKKENDKHLHIPEVKLMSPLTRDMLNAVDYGEAAEKRRRNFAYARELFDQMNQLDMAALVDENSVPMGYPLLVDFEIIPEFHRKHIYQPHYWEYILEEFGEDTLEYKLAKYMALLCTDQRYGKEEIDWQYDIIQDLARMKNEI